MTRAAFVMDRMMAAVGSVGSQLYPAAILLCLRNAGHHGDTQHHGPKRTVGDDFDRSADDLFGALAGVHADHRRIYPAQQVGPGIGLQGLVLFAL